MWLANTAASDEGAVRVVLLSTMGALLIASLAVPHAFGEDALVFGVAYFVVRAAHIAAYVAVSRGDPQLRDVVVRLATTFLPAAALLVAGRRRGRPRADRVLDRRVGDRLRRADGARRRRLARERRRTSPSATG